MIEDFWTSERIESAVPKLKRKSQKQKQFRGIQVETRALVGAPVPVTVSDDDRKKPPYNSVGILLFTVNGKHYRGTAYAAKTGSAKNVVFTAAHNLIESAGESDNILFVPAMQSNFTRPYGSFKQISGGLRTAFFVHPDYDVQTEPDAYDLGAVKLQKNGKNQELGEAVPLLDIIVDQKYNSSSMFAAIGYPETNEMQKNTGKYLRSEDSGETIVKEGEIPQGSSGGPWLLGISNTVNGNNASIAGGEQYSPYYSQTKIDAVINQF